MSPEIHLRLYEELNDFLPPDKRKRRFAYRLDGSTTVRRLLANLGVPGNEVEVVLINGNSVGFSHDIKAGDFVSIFPVFESLDVTSLLSMRRKPLRRIRFMTGAGLLRLSGYLRRLGFDTVDARSWKPEKIIRAAKEERRILLTKNPALLKWPELPRAFLIKARKPKHQLIDVLSRFDLCASARFSGCQSSIVNRR
jgi:sulfur carrier protein ThiS